MPGRYFGQCGVMVGSQVVSLSRGLTGRTTAGHNAWDQLTVKVLATNMNR